MQATKSDIFSKLQTDILRLQGFKENRGHTILDLELNPIVQRFPNASFPIGSTHEFLLSALENYAATSAFISALISSWLNTTGAIVWISSEHKLLPTALEPFGIEPDRFIFTTVSRERDLLWVTEEALKCPAVAAVICEVRDISFTASRRLQLAVEESQTTGFIIRYDRPKVGTTACVSRWRISQLPSEVIDELPGIGFPKWKVELLRVRSGQPGVWNVQWSEYKFHYEVETRGSKISSLNVTKAG